MNPEDIADMRAAMEAIRAREGAKRLKPPRVEIGEAVLEPEPEVRVSVGDVTRTDDGVVDTESIRRQMEGPHVEVGEAVLDRPRRRHRY